MSAARRARCLAVSAALVLGALGTAAPGASAQAGACPKLALASTWYGDNADRIQAVIDARGTCAGLPGGRPLAVFDWDNTITKNDTADQTFFWMLRHDKLLQPARRDWGTTSRFMTRAGARALRRACGALAAPGRPLPTSTHTRCADELLSFRTDEETTGGDPAFAGYDHRRMEGAYAWMAQLMEGRRPSAVRAFARAARRLAITRPRGATQRVGSSREGAWVRYYPQMRDLVKTLRTAGFDVWVISAGPQEWTEVWSASVGVDAAHTVGIRTLRRDGRITPHLQGCGGIPDGRDTIMTYVDGKRCWINQAVLGIQGAPALQPAPEARRQAVAGGDADTDVTMVRDATGVHIAINRNKPELMCRAYANQDGRWIVNPMFIEPLPRFTAGYPCSTKGMIDASGKESPVIGDDGAVIPDQADRVFVAG
jgi:haloacid dehalogenase-like hydrolase